MKTVCDLCFHHCALEEGQTGLCRARACRGGRVVPLNYGRLTALALDPIEKKPLRRFHPGSLVCRRGASGATSAAPSARTPKLRRRARRASPVTAPPSSWSGPP